MSLDQRTRPDRGVHDPAPNVLHLGCGENYRDDAHNVDAVADVDPDEVADLNARPWPWPDNSFHKIRAAHVIEHLTDIEGALRECARVLTPSGTAAITVPMGLDAVADPDHTWGERREPWTWRTPVFYCGARHWDVDVGLDVVDRSVRVWSMAPEIWRRRYQTARWRLRQHRHGAGPWCFDLSPMSGEFTVVFRA